MQQSRQRSTPMEWPAADQAGWTWWAWWVGATGGIAWVTRTLRPGREHFWLMLGKQPPEAAHG